MRDVAWLRTDAWALVAVERDRLAGIIVLSAGGGDMTWQFTPGTRACCGLSLREAPGAGGRRIGLALLSRSLVDARDRGYVTNVTAVWSRNTPMLVATSQLLGFVPIGSATHASVLGRGRWWWRIHGRRGRGPHLVYEPRSASAGGADRS
jgi:hypothetical protein